MAGTVDFSEVQSAVDGHAVILDVRNKDEVESQGHIRGATTCVRDILTDERNIAHFPRHTTTTSAMAGTVDFSEVQSAVDGHAVILDVRNKDEVESQGHIRGAKNVPLSELENAISLDDDEFKSQYHFDKPSKDDEIITHCMRSGSGRAQKAADTLIAQGYSHVKVYKGSFTDWKAHGGEVVMPDSS